MARNNFLAMWLKKAVRKNMAQAILGAHQLIYHPSDYIEFSDIISTSSKIESAPGREYHARLVDTSLYL